MTNLPQTAAIAAAVGPQLNTLAGVDALASAIVAGCLIDALKAQQSVYAAQVATAALATPIGDTNTPLTLLAVCVQLQTALSPLAAPPKVGP